MAKWTDTYIRAIPAPEGKSPRRVFENSPDRTLYGFGIQITPAGGRTFFVSYTSPTTGKRRSMKLGTYPTTSLADARERCREQRRLIDAGTDPMDARDAAKKAQREQAEREKALGTVADLFRLYIAHLKSQGKRSAREVEAIFTRDIEPQIGTIKARDVTPDDITTVLASVVDRAQAGKRGTGHTLANRTRAYLRAAFALGQGAARNPTLRGKAPPFEITANPVESAGKATKREAPRQRWLSPEELQHVWREMGEPYSRTYAVRRGSNTAQIEQSYKVDPTLVLAVKWMLATGQRVQEVLGSEWSEIDRKEQVWTIPAGRRKNREKNASAEPHIVPLTKFHINLLDEIAANQVDGSRWLFPSPRDSGKTAPETSLSQALRRWCDRVEMERFQPRDLRRTWKTLAGRAGVDLEIRNRIQGHAMSDIGSRHYDRYDYLQEKRDGMRRWAEWLARTVEEETNAEEEKEYDGDADSDGVVTPLEQRA